jgi:hypothetical protein
MLPFNPFSFQPDQRPQYRSSKEGDVLRKQQDAERHHPESNTGRKPKTPKMIRSSPTRTRTSATMIV